MQRFHAVSSSQGSGLIETVTLKNGLEGCLDVSWLGEPSGNHGFEFRELCAGKQDWGRGQAQLEICGRRLAQLLGAEKEKEKL